MNWFRNLKVGKKLLIAFLIILVIAVAVTIYGLLELVAVDTNYSDAMTLSKSRFEYIYSLKDDLSTARMTMREIFYPGTTQDDLNRLSGQLDTSMNDLSDNLTKLRVIASDSVQSTIDTVAPLADKYHTDGKAVIQNLIAVGDTSIDNPVYRTAMEAAHQEILRMGTDYANNMTTSIVDISTKALQVLADLTQQNGDAANRAQTVTVIVLVVMAVIIILIAVYISGLITKPLIPITNFMHRAGTTGDLMLRKEDMDVINKYGRQKDELGMLIDSAVGFVNNITIMSKNLEIIASGDLTVEIKPLSDADTMGRAMKQTVDSFNNMFSEINNATTQVSAGSKQIADGAQALAQGSTEQAASVQQLLAAINDVALKTQDNAQKAERAAALAGSIKDKANMGSRQMDDMMMAVKDINTASHSISKVIKVIDDIAFQTNILALNAAVEAARAGQHGKGFAVVAEEVRNLAAKSAEAAKDTGGLIANSMEKAELGTRIAGETAESLTEIVAGINESSEIISEIAKSSNEQSMGIAQINTGIDQVALVIQQNSATAEESAAASQEMSSQSNMLEEMIEQFKLADNGTRGGNSRDQQRRAQIPERTYYTGRGDAGGFGKY